MDFYKVPTGFGMALAMDQPAMNAYAAMTEPQKQDILNKAHNVKSEKEMYALVASLANGTGEYYQETEAIEKLPFLGPDCRQSGI